MIGKDGATSGHPAGLVRRTALRAFRIGALALIAWLVRDQHLRASASVYTSVSAAEVKEYFPEVFALRPDETVPDLLVAVDRGGGPLGTVVRTMPACRNIRGYSGNTDVLIALDEDRRVLGVRVRSSEDTRRYVEEVTGDLKFLRTWDGMSAKKAAALDFEKAGLQGVTGASATSRAIERSVAKQLGLVIGKPVKQPSLRWTLRDWGIVAVMFGAVVTSLLKIPGRRWIRRGFQLLVIAYIGFLNADFVTLKLMTGWMKSGVPWDVAPGLVLLGAAALLVPWASGKPYFCGHICPHGAVQEWIGWFTQGRFVIALRHDVTAGLRWLPASLLGLALITTMLGVGFELTDVEPFDAYNAMLRTTGWATLSVAVVGLLASAFVPRAYCKYGCPTGALLEFVRDRGWDDQFSRRDWVAVLLVLLAVALRFAGGL